MIISNEQKKAAEQITSTTTMIGTGTTIDGNIEIGELLTLKKTAVINGDIVTNKLVIELGAFFNGKCVMGAATRNLKVADAGKGFFSLSEATRKL